MLQVYPKIDFMFLVVFHGQRNLKKNGCESIFSATCTFVIVKWLIEKEHKCFQNWSTPSSVVTLDFSLACELHNYNLDSIVIWWRCVLCHSFFTKNDDFSIAFIYLLRRFWRKGVEFILVFCENNMMNQ